MTLLVVLTTSGYDSSYLSGEEFDDSLGYFQIHQSWYTVFVYRRKIAFRYCDISSVKILIGIKWREELNVPSFF